MASVRKADIKLTPTPIRAIDRIAEASGTKPYCPPIALPVDLRLFSSQPSNIPLRNYIPPVGTITLVQYDPSFRDIIGQHPTHSLLIASEKPFFHEACVFTPSNQELWITSNGISTMTEKGKLVRSIFISRLKLDRVGSHKHSKQKEKEGGWEERMECHNREHSADGASESKVSKENDGEGNAIIAVSWTKMKPPPGVSMPNGAVNGLPLSSNSILICAQGHQDGAPGGIYLTSNRGTVPVVTNFHGRPFNSPNDVVVDKTGGIWFTDPSYGFDQGFKGSPQLPEQVYRYDPSTGDLRCVADNFGRPNGICFNKEETICYITDTSTSRGKDTDDPRLPSTIYAFDIQHIHGQPQLTNRRVFAFVTPGFPDGIKTDINGNVYSGCGDGVQVWNQGGVLIGKISTGDWVANFCFGEEGEIFICNETRVWRVQLDETARGALLGI